MSGQTEVAADRVQHGLRGPAPQDPFELAQRTAACELGAQRVRNEGRQGRRNPPGNGVPDAVEQPLPGTRPCTPRA